MGECAVPLYEYRCAKCKKGFERIEKHSARRTQKCPHCGGKAERQFSAPGFQFKGSGWYVTDYARAAGAAGKKEEGTGEAKEVKDGTEVKETKEAKETKKDGKKEKKHK